jgi:hypothetical protein
MSTAIKERPILFSAPMVRAILEGRKTQTRRVLDRMTGFKVSQFDRSDTPGYDWHFRCQRGLWQDMDNAEVLSRCPYGQPGDRLWVRETWAVVPHVTDNGPKHKANGDGTGATWRADWDGNPSGFKWTPSIHMPRWASRLTLEITDVRVERLQGISEADARQEGTGLYSYDPIVGHMWTPVAGQVKCGSSIAANAIECFQCVWQSINGPDSWSLNPWVWVLEFKRVEAGQ